MIVNIHQPSGIFINHDLLNQSSIVGHLGCSHFFYHKVHNDKHPLFSFLLLCLFLLRLISGSGLAQYNRVYILHFDTIKLTSFQKCYTNLFSHKHWV